MCSETDSESYNRIDGHGLGAVLGLNAAQRAQFVSRVFVEDVDLPGAARYEHRVGVGSKTLESTPSLIGNDWITLPLSASIITRSAGPGQEKITARVLCPTR